MSEFEIELSSQFKKDYKKYQKSERDRELIQNTIKILSIEGTAGIPQNMLPHKLKGICKGFWECYIKPDLLLIWKQFDEPNFISFARVGSHSELF